MFRPVHGLILALIIVAAGAYFVAVKLEGGASATVAPGGAKGGLREVDFGLAELDPGGQPVRIPSYKNGGMMVLYAGEELQFEAVGNSPLPTIQLRLGETVQPLPGASGRITIVGPANQALPVTLSAQGQRLSLPGGAPPRVSVKVQVFGPARPKG